MFVIASEARQSITLLAQHQTLDCFTAFAMTVDFICNDDLICFAQCIEVNGNFLHLVQ
jgi:hypothetical protein